MVVNPNSKMEVGVSQLNTVVELLYKICCDIHEWGYENLKYVVSWLSNLADAGAQVCNL